MESVLVRLPNHVGDIVMSLPAIQLLEVSGYRPCLIGKKFAGDLVAGMGWRFDPIEGHVLEDIARVREIADEIGPAPKGLLLPNSLGSALQMRLAGVKAAGYNTDSRRLLLETVIPDAPRMHEVRRFWTVAREAIKAWGVTPPAEEPPKRIGLKLLNRHVAAARNQIQRHRIPKRFALIAPIAKGLHHGKVKHWAHYAQIIEPLRQMGIEPVAFPAKREVEATRAALPGAMVLPPVELGTYAAIAARAAIVIANDSGISHVAAGIGAPQLTIIGVTDTDRTSPWSPRSVLVGENGRWPTVDEVLEKIRAIVQA